MKLYYFGRKGVKKFLNSLQINFQSQNQNLYLNQFQ